ncbi:diaminobutyrate acetyltransferase [Sporosarcina siberiensis]|uniref:L-2,4-diaminobutyric acid acetyltransferase n=1 Tax=Sporosarcina siberiensis TaxID=1365606 RepID=A0ABW4SJW9_9BACL
MEKKSQVAVLERKEELLFRTPTEEDGKDVWQLIKNTGVLDLNSSYSYLMWSKFFDETSIVVETNKQIVGFISGFIQPKSADTLFVWQVAVDESARGKGLASRMLHENLHSDACRNIRYLEATIGPSNEASQALFLKLARDLKTTCKVTECFTENQFPGSGHEDELLFTIGPF